MIYLAANNSQVWGYLELGYPIGWMMSPAGYRKPWRGDKPMPYALDNGMYHPPTEPPKPESALDDFYKMLSRAIQDDNQPIFVTCPDVPYDGDATRKRSKEHRQRIIDAGYTGPIAIAVQNGMTPDDLEGYDAVFVAGSTDWKWETAESWCDEAHDRGMWAHIARVNTMRRIRQCIDYHADSADGTGMWRGGAETKRRILEPISELHLFRKDIGWTT